MSTFFQQNTSQQQSQRQNIAQKIYNIQKTKILLSKTQEQKNVVQNILNQYKTITMHADVQNEFERELVPIDDFINEPASEISDYYTSNEESLSFKSDSDGPRYQPDIPDDRNKYFSINENTIESILKEISLLKCPANIPRPIFIDICQYIINSMDDNGFIPNPEEMYEAYNNYSKTEHGVFFGTEGIKIVHEFLKSNLKPPGILTKDSLECIMFQIEQDTKPENAILRDFALDILQKHKTEFIESLKHGVNIDKIARLSTFDKFSNREKNAELLLNYIKKFNPFPLESVSEQKVPSRTNSIDYRVVEENGVFKVIPLYEVKIIVDNDYRREIASIAPKVIEHEINIENKVNKLLNDCKLTSKRVLEYVLNYQRDYMLTGDLNTIKPLRNKDIAETLQISESAVSSILHNKMFELPDGKILTAKHLTERGITFIKNGQTHKISESQLADVIKSMSAVAKNKSEILNELKREGYILSKKTISKVSEKYKIKL